MEQMPKDIRAWLIAVSADRQAALTAANEQEPCRDITWNNYLLFQMCARSMREEIDFKS